MKDKNFYQTEDVKIHYAEGPENGSIIVMLHRGGGNWESFLTVAPSLTERWHVFVLDFRGHGMSGRVEGAYQLQSYAKDVIYFLQGKFDRSVILWGQSLGASVAIHIAANSPDLVRALIVEEPVVDISEVDKSRLFLQILRNLAASGQDYEKIKEELANLPIPIQGQDETVRLGDLRGESYLSLTASCVHAADPGIFDFLIDGRALRGYNVEELFQQVSCPTLFLQGNPDLMGMSHETAKYGASLIPGSKHVYVENAGHNLHRTQPEIVVTLVEDFLESYR